MITLERLLIGAALAALLAVAAGAARASALVPPPGYLAATGHSSKDAPECAATPAPYTGPLDFPSKYTGSDAARDDLNPAAYAEFKAKTAAISTLEKTVSSMVSSYMHSGQAQTLDCVLGWLDAWARAGALEGPAENHPGKSVRKWALGSVASAWVRLKFSSSRPLKSKDEQVRRIDAWLDRLGTLVMADWKDQPRERINNHQYWAAWAALADAVALDRRDLFDWAVAQFRIAAQQVDGEGYLDNELRRDTRALAYHNYALAPLVMIAAFAHANGVELAGENHGALQRLAALVLKAIDEPKLFEDKTGDAQITDDLQAASKFAWLEPYCALYSCDARIQAKVKSLRPLKTYRLGGNLTDLFAPPAAPTHASRQDDARALNN